MLVCCPRAIENTVRIDHQRAALSLSLSLFLSHSLRFSFADRSRRLNPPGRAKSKLPLPKPGMTPHILEKDKEQKEEVTWRTYDVAEYDRLSASYEDPKTMKWKLLPKPGGQAVKPEDYYTLKACIKQVEEGDPPKEQPMWTENGAVDYNGRALFQEWNKLKGKTKDEAKQAFCYAYGKALSEQRFSLNFRKY